MAIYRGSGGSTSTTDQATIDQVAEDAATATTKASEAASSASDAASSASSASSSASSAASSASTATTKASEASTSATNAASSASAASTSETNAASSATSASDSATNAASEAAAALSSKALALDAQTAAETAESNASDHADDAVKAAYGAEDVLQTLSDTSEIYSARHYAAKAAASSSGIDASVTAAAASATAAAASETAAASSESAADTSANAAATSASAAASSATSASGSATTATIKASEAATSATAAASSATAAAASETAAAASESAAATSETNAATSASAASTSASNASTSASSAATSASNASASADAALAALDSFDDRYLGQKASDPTLDNDGNALVAGALYFNTTDNTMKVYDGSNWLAAYASLSGALIAANNLSDLESASTARTNLGVAIGTDVQAYSSVLAGTTASFTTADETKLDGIETAATADQTAQEIATAIDADATAEATLKSALGLGTAAYTASTDYATAAQGALADSATQPGDNVSTLTNDSGYITGNQTITLSGDVSGSGTTSIAVTVADDSHNHIISNVDGLQTALDGKQPLSTVLTNTTASFTTEDESKLDGIEAGATADQTKADIDALGIAASTAATLATARTINGVSFDGSANITVEPYISGDDTGDTNCPITFTANSTAGYKRLYEDSAFYFDNTNNYCYAGQFIANSDRNLKDNIEVVENALGKLEKINGVTFNWKESNEPDAGVIAQEIQEVLPQAVKENTNNHLSVNYGALTALLIQAIKEQQAQIDQLKAQL